MERTPLPPDSHTAHRLEHATPLHLHLTTRRTFIGPISESWLRSHRQQWWRDHVPLTRSAPRTAATGNPNAALPGLDGARDGAFLNVPASGSRRSEETRTTSVTQNRQPSDVTTSTTSLLRGENDGAGRDGAGPRQDVAAAEEIENDDCVGQTDGAQRRQRPTDVIDRAVSKVQALPQVRFSDAAKLQLRERASRLVTRRGSMKRTKVQAGELLKMDKMLVRVDITQQSIGTEFDERLSQRIETKSIDKWREFMVVCRSHESTGGVLQLYQTRVIASKSDATKKKPTASIVVSPSGGRTNLYSSLDKTLCIWTVVRGKTKIYYLRPQSGATSMEWYTFLGSLVGCRRTETLQVNVPDLNVSLRLEDPFQTAEAAKTLRDAANGDDTAMAKAMSDERGAAGAILTRCIDQLTRSGPQWEHVLKLWAEHERIGLAWKRYDRLEWVHGTGEQRMYGTLAMQKTHDLELRPKKHYPLSVETNSDGVLQEPSPVEGFLIRLTSQRGQSKRLGKEVFKKLYYYSHDHFLVFCGFSRATPPPPPAESLKRGEELPSIQQIVEASSLTYDVAPYALNGAGSISWLSAETRRSTAELQINDANAEAEAQRNVNMLRSCDGFVDLCSITQVRTMQRNDVVVEGAENATPELDVSHPDRPAAGSVTDEVEISHTFELITTSGLVIRLRADNQTAKDEWIRRLRELVTYWKQRFREDMKLFKSVRQRNLDALRIDDSAEATVGSFAYKWEVKQSYADPLMYNFCGISRCRTVHLSGLLFRKPRKHTAFKRCYVILSAGHLLVFQDTLRKGTGAQAAHAHHERIGSIDLRGCYLYSGLLTEDDLLHQDQSFDSNQPGHHAIPRIYPADGWTSTDEDAMTTFVIWHAKSQAWCRSSQFVDDVRMQERQDRRTSHSDTAASINIGAAENRSRKEKTKTKLERVSKLGATGRSVVFKARSRAERDHWVLSIQVEIERLTAEAEASGRTDEARIVNGPG